MSGQVVVGRRGDRRDYMDALLEHGGEVVEQPLSFSSASINVTVLVSYEGLEGMEEAGVGIVMRDSGGHLVAARSMNLGVVGTLLCADALA
ncbi:hypothetical protein RHSIM_Rhsim07G0188100 [Rhododendron simsii]|uniref:Uncharacterized protein n=1 Tax=Rhododendron simsii TaxID=118357 RepID=A0A834GUB2_RHOSS|nr:hypothetical protein RHSIM_Rhsim07G0188100 [Rhododendron simsii]